MTTITQSPSFPLYDRILEEEILDTDFLNITEKLDLVFEIKNLEQQEHELIYVLIRTFERDSEEQNKIDNTPFGSKQLKKGIKFDIHLLPEELVVIISRFVNMHKISKVFI